MEKGRAVSENKPGVFAGFKEFLMRGNVIELAVAVVIGVAFTNIVNAVVEGLINPVVGAIGTQDLNEYELCIRDPCGVDKSGEITGVLLSWGTVLSATITFLMTAAVVYFLMVLPMNRYKARQDARKAGDNTPPEKTELDILTEIRDELIAQRANDSEGSALPPQSEYQPR